MCTLQTSTAHCQTGFNGGAITPEELAQFFAVYHTGRRGTPEEMERAKERRARRNCPVMPQTQLEMDLIHEIERTDRRRYKRRYKILRGVHCNANNKQYRLCRTHI